MHHGQPQACSLTNTFGGKKRFEDFLLHLIRHSLSGIADRQAGPFSPRTLSGQDCRCFNRQPPARRHGVAGIDNKIHDDLFKLSRVCLDDNRLWGRE